jgi:hypothetical protein
MLAPVSAASVAFLVSIVAGGFGSLVGIGGGLVIVPALTIALGYDIKVAIGASLVGVIATSVAASAHFLETGIADRRLGLPLLVATAIGGLTGGLTAGLLDDRFLALLFGILLLVVSMQMLRQLRSPAHPTAAEGAEVEGFDSHYIEPGSGETVTYRATRMGLGAAISFIAGNVSGLLGVGGGVINVPTMNVLMRVPIRVATTTSTYMLGATAAASAMLYAASGELDPMVAAPVALGVFVGARSGARLSLRLSQQVIRLVFVAVALFFALQMFARFLDP